MSTAKSTAVTLKLIDHYVGAPNTDHYRQRIKEEIEEHLSSVGSVHNVSVFVPDWKDYYPKFWDRIRARVGWFLIKHDVIRSVYDDVRLVQIIFPYRVMKAVEFIHTTDDALSNFMESIYDPSFDFNEWMKQNTIPIVQFVLDAPDKTSVYAEFEFQPIQSTEHINVNFC